MRKGLFLLTLFLSSTFVANAQQEVQTERRLVSVPRAFFVPHWYIKAQGGAAYDVGEAKFSQLLSPALQISMGYKFSEIFGVRGSVSGLWAKNRYAYPESEYKWNFIQPALEAEVDLTQLFLGRDPERLHSIYAFAGVGAALSFNNDDAVDANNAYHGKKYYTMYDYVPHTEPFQKLWKDTRWNPVVRAGIGYDYRIADEISIGAEVNANMLPDHFNSKLGKRDNKDWHFNALLGIKFNIGHSHGRTEPVYEDVPKAVTPPAQFVDVPAEKISFNVNIYFVINQSIIRANQMDKLTRLLKYLDEHPKAFVRLSGYADKETGNPTINMRLSIERSQAVSKYLQDAGVPDWRIRRFAKGDKVQPFDIPEENRVCICYVYDPDNPTPQRFEY
jgi:outer membrane protein OmpA-like peptidoglycan-associated protein